MNYGDLGLFSSGQIYELYTLETIVFPTKTCMSASITIIETNVSTKMTLNALKQYSDDL